MTDTLCQLIRSMAKMVLLNPAYLPKAVAWTIVTTVRITALRHVMPCGGHGEDTLLPLWMREVPCSRKETSYYSRDVTLDGRKIRNPTALRVLLAC
jgi:hypothetical protein